MKRWEGLGHIVGLVGRRGGVSVGGFGRVSVGGFGDTYLLNVFGKRYMLRTMWFSASCLFDE